jgi:hypothetical protein
LLDEDFETGLAWILKSAASPPSLQRPKLRNGNGK